VFSHPCDIDFHPQAIFIQISKWSNNYGGKAEVLFALLLEPTGPDSSEYRRKGIARIPEEYGISTLRWYTRTITII
jgi:hypothetical protein